MTPFSAMRTRNGILAPGSDPDFASVSLLLPMNGANGGSSFPDVSSYAHTMTPFGPTTPPTTSTAQSKWGGSSFLNTDNNGALNGSTAGTEWTLPGALTYEVWFYPTSGGASRLWDHGTNVSTGTITPSTGEVGIYHISGYAVNGSGAAISLNTWHFLQVVRTGSTLSVYVDNVLYGTATYSSTLGGGNLYVAAYAGGSSGASFLGHMQDFRITKGVARPIAVPTASFPTF